MGWYFYETSPIDWWGTLCTAEEKLQSLLRSEFAEYSFDEYSFKNMVQEADYFLRAVNQARLYWTDMGWEGDGVIRVGELLVPNARPMLYLAVKQLNNGATYIASEFPYPADEIHQSRESDELTLP